MKKAIWHKAILLLVLLLLLGCVAAIGQEITGPDEVGTNQPAWLKLDVPDGSVGKFDGHLLDIDPDHVAPGAALFFATESGVFRIVAAIVDAEQNIEFIEHTIVVVGGGEHPQPVAITKANVLKWLSLVPAAVRSETITNPITGEELTRQQAVGETFLNIGKAGPALGAVGAMDQMLSTALVSAMGNSSDDWKSFGVAVDAGLANLKDRDVSVADYAAAFLTVGEVLTDE